MVSRTCSARPPRASATPETGGYALASREIGRSLVSSALATAASFGIGVAVF
jgi:hypothetical protein